MYNELSAFFCEWFGSLSLSKLINTNNTSNQYKVKKFHVWHLREKARHKHVDVPQSPIVSETPKRTASQEIIHTLTILWQSCSTVELRGIIILLVKGYYNPHLLKTCTDHKTWGHIKPKFMENNFSVKTRDYIRNYIQQL